MFTHQREMVLCIFVWIARTHITFIYLLFINIYIHLYIYTFACDQLNPVLWRYAKTDLNIVKKKINRIGNSRIKVIG